MFSAIRKRPDEPAIRKRPDEPAIRKRPDEPAMRERFTSSVKLEVVVLSAPEVCCVFLWLAVIIVAAATAFNKGLTKSILAAPLFFFTLPSAPGFIFQTTLCLHGCCLCGCCLDDCHGYCQDERCGCRHYCDFRYCDCLLPDEACALVLHNLPA